MRLGRSPSEVLVEHQATEELARYHFGTGAVDGRLDLMQLPRRLAATLKDSARHGPVSEDLVARLLGMGPDTGPSAITFDDFVIKHNEVVVALARRRDANGRPSRAGSGENFMVPSGSFRRKSVTPREAEVNVSMPTFARRSTLQGTLEEKATVAQLRGG